MASQNDIRLAFQRSGIGRDPTDEELSFYANYADAGKVEGDIRAGGGGASNGGPNSVPKFEFDQAAAEKTAMEELRPYYEMLLKIYDGDVGLAKKRIERDYERGLRYKKEETKNALGDNEEARLENSRKFKIALDDLGQEMNGRMMFNSGIKETDTQNANAENAFQQNQYANEARNLTLGEKKYIEEENAKRSDFMVDEGFEASGVSGYYNNRQKKIYGWTQEQIEKARTQATNKRTQKANDYNMSITPLATATPKNYQQLVDAGLTIAGLPTTS